MANKAKAVMTIKLHRLISDDEQSQLVAEFDALLERWSAKSICWNDILCVLEDEIHDAQHFTRKNPTHV